MNYEIAASTSKESISITVMHAIQTYQYAMRLFTQSASKICIAIAFAKFSKRVQI